MPTCIKQAKEKVLLPMPPPESRLRIHLFIQQIYTEHLLCARNFSEVGYSHAQDRQMGRSSMEHVSVGWERGGDRKTSKRHRKTEGICKARNQSGERGGKAMIFFNRVVGLPGKKSDI